MKPASFEYFSPTSLPEALQLLAELRAMCELRGLAAAKLEGNRMLFIIELQVTRDVAMDECAGRDHLGVQARAQIDLTQKEPAVPVSHVHHRGDENCRGF